MCTTVNNLNCSVPWNPVGASPQGYELSLFFSINGLLENLLKLVPLRATLYFGWACLDDD